MSIFGSARVERGTLAYEETNRAAKALAGMGCDIVTGGGRLVLKVPSWEDFLVLAFDEIRFYGASSIQVMRRMRALLQELTEHVPPPRREALERYLARVDKGIRKSFEDVDDRNDALEEERQGLGLAREREGEE